MDQADLSCPEALAVKTWRKVKETLLVSSASNLDLSSTKKCDQMGNDASSRQLDCRHNSGANLIVLKHICKILRIPNMSVYFSSFSGC